MRRNNYLSVIAWLIVSQAAALGEQPAPAAPAVNPLDQRFLTRLVRSTLEQHITDGSVYEPQYVPPALGAVQCQVIVTLRQFGYVRGVGGGPTSLIADSCRDAALAALDDARSVGPVSLEWLDRLRIEIEAIGWPVPVQFTGKWSDPGAFRDIIEPGVHGMILQFGQVEKRFCPSEIITKCITVQDAVRSIAQQVVQTPEELASADMFRFRTTHWHEVEPGGRVVQLHRGVVPIQPDAVTEDNLDKTIQHLADYLIYRQLPTGWFSYLYEPSSDTYVEEEDNLVRQSGVAWALAAHGREFGRSASSGAAEMALERFLKRTAELPGVPNAAFVTGYNERHKLGITAMTVLGLIDHVNAGKYAPTRERLLNGIYWLQRPSGEFVTAFPPSRKFSSQHYFPGEALLAIARDYEENPNQRAVDSFAKAYEFYLPYFRADPMPPFVPWQAQAFSRMAIRTKKKEYADFVFEMVDWLLDRQNDESNCQWPELIGGVAAYADFPPGVATAAYLEGIADALMLARALGDEHRAERYERAVRLAARFVMQLQFRPDEAYYVRSKKDTVWGIRSTLCQNHLRIDHTQHALMALMKVRRLLFHETD